MDRREFAALLPALLGGSALAPEGVEAQYSLSGLGGIQSGVYKPMPSKAGSQEGHSSSHYVTGMLKAGYIRLEMHESTIQAGAEHEPVGTRLHSEIWLVREGTAELTTNGVARTMVAGDVGVCCAGDKHFIANTSDKPVTYFVVTVGPPE
ncbi:MAG: Cupin 2 conserved barrel domain protein [Edaphobacter sp.]|nr:Cupin 2 conserved barrel domain protein [Edaphobacter sp.]